MKGTNVSNLIGDGGVKPTELQGGSRAGFDPETGANPSPTSENVPTASQTPANGIPAACKTRRKAVVRGVRLGGKEWDFWFGKDGVCVHRKHTRAEKTELVSFALVATGAGLEVEVNGRIFRAALRKEGLAFCEVRNRARTKLLPWRRVALLDAADDSAVQPSLFKELA